MFITGISAGCFMNLNQTLIQAHSPHAVMGRVMSIYMMEFGITNFGVFGVAILADAVGIQWAIGSLAAILVLVTFYYLLFVPKIRNLP